MNIQGLDYNTTRRRLELPEYGREIKKMVEHALTITDRRERQACAETIVATMQRVAPGQAEGEEARNKYWDHLALLSDFKLDIDYPSSPDEARRLHTKPERVAYAPQDGRACHYGVLLFETFEKLRQMPAGEERDTLARRTAAIMYRCLRDYGLGNADEARVADELAYYTDGVIRLDPETITVAPYAPLKRPAEKKKKRK
ncbi:MAG: DUF4290 domain-containing protein [Prevotella sp.]|nr:DUF4290 domain-containing protein [Prevotella sp.]